MWKTRWKVELWYNILCAYVFLGYAYYIIFAIYVIWYIQMICKIQYNNSVNHVLECDYLAQYLTNNTTNNS